MDQIQNPINQFNKHHSQHESSNDKNNSIEELNEDDILRLSGEKLIEVGIRALNKSPTHRGKSDINILVRLTEEIQFFKNHFGQNHHSLLQEYTEYFGYQKFNQGQTVFRQGDIGDKFYLILRGKVKVVVALKRQQIKEEKGKKISKDYEEFIDIKELSSGETFGELALIDQKPRGASIICIEDCDFITFDKDSFIKILKDQETEKLRNEIRQLNKIYLFKDFSLNLLKNIYLLFTVNNYQRGDTLFREGDASDKLYVIREGEFKIGILGKLQPLGEEEFFMGGNREVTAVCVSKDALVMAINKKDLLKKMSYDQNSIRLMYNRAKEKNQYRENKLQFLKAKYQEDLETIMLKNYQKNKFKLNYQLDQLEDDSEIQQFIELNTSNKIENNKQNNKNFIQPDSNTIRPKSNTLQQLGLKKYAQSQLEKQDSPRSQKFGNYSPRGGDSNFKINSPRQIKTDSNQESLRNNRKQNSYFNGENSINTSQYRSRENSINNKNPFKILKNSSDIIEGELNQETEVQYNFSSFFNKINSLKHQNSSDSNKNSPYEQVRPMSSSVQIMKNNSIFSSQTPNQNNNNNTISNNKKRSIKLKINEKLLQNEQQNCEKKADTSQENTNNQLANQQIISSDNSGILEENETKQPQPSQFYQNSKKNQPSLHHQTLQTKNNRSIQTNFTIPDQDDNFQLRMVQSQKLIQREQTLYKPSLLSPRSQAQDLYFNVGSSQRDGNENEDEGDMYQVSIQNSRIDLLSQTNQQGQQVQTNQSITQSQVKIPYKSKRSIIIHQDKSRNTQLSKKCKDFILNLDNEVISQKAKTKSIQKNPFLYIDEFPLPKNVQTNLEDKDVDRLIQEKILNSVMRGSVKRNSTFLSPKFEQSEKVFQFFNPDNNETKSDLQQTNSQIQSKTNDSNEDSFQAFLNYQSTTNESEKIIKIDEQRQSSNKQNSKQKQEIDQISQQKQKNIPKNALPIQNSLTDKKQIRETHRFIEKVAFQSQRPQSSYLAQSSTPTALKKVNTVEDRYSFKRNLTRPQTAQSNSMTRGANSTHKTRGSISGQLKFIQFDDLPQSPVFSHIRQFSQGNVVDRSLSKKPLDQEFQQQIEQFITKTQIIKSTSTQGNGSIHRPKSSQQAVFKHGFKNNPCSQVNNQIYHVYNCKEKNDGKCQCQSNHLNYLPLKFRTEMILQNQLAIKKNNFSVRRQGKLFQNVL